MDSKGVKLATGIVDIFQLHVMDSAVAVWGFLAGVLLFQLHVMDSVREKKRIKRKKWRNFQLHVMDSIVSSREECERLELSTPCNGFH